MTSTKCFWQLFKMHLLSLNFAHFSIIHCLSIWLTIIWKLNLMMIMCLMCSLYIDELNCFSKRDCWTQIFINSVQMCIYLLLYYLKLCMHAVNTIWMNDKVIPRAMTKKKFVILRSLILGPIWYSLLVFFCSFSLYSSYRIKWMGSRQNKHSIEYNNE